MMTTQRKHPSPPISIALALLASVAFAALFLAPGLSPADQRREGKWPQGMWCTGDGKTCIATAYRDGRWSLEIKTARFHDRYKLCVSTLHKSGWKRTCHEFALGSRKAKSGMYKDKVAYCRHFPTKPTYTSRRVRWYHHGRQIGPYLGFWGTGRHCR